MRRSPRGDNQRQRTGLPGAVLTSLWATLLSLAVGMVALSFLVPATPTGPATDATPAAVGVPPEAAPAPAPAVYGPVEPAFLPAAPAAPQRLIIRGLHVDAPIVPIALADDGNLEPPSNYTTVGWWDGSAQPGSAVGQTVITGHSVHYGGGALDDLPQLRHGPIDVVTPQGVVRYRVTKAIVATHAQVAQYAQQLFGQQHRSPRHPARLVLITCTDYNGQFWENNFIILAQQLGRPRPT